MDFREHSVEELAGDVAEGRRSARELTQAALDRIAELDPALNAFVAVDGERALADADAVDVRIGLGEPVGPLAGIPIGVKDLEDAAGFVTTRGSLVFAGDPPAATDSILVGRLRAAGCVVVGKTNTPEFGHKGDTVNRVFGATHNPWDLTRSAGGSSGGSAAALAAGMIPLATGSDGGGSIRIPAALCGMTGLKPSLGRVPTGGPQAPNWPDLSVKAPMALRGRDLALALDVVQGPDPTDLRALPRFEGSFLSGLDGAAPPARVLWSSSLGYAPVDPEVLAICESAVARLAAAGTEVVEHETVFDIDPVLAWYTLTAAGNQRSIDHYRHTDRWEQLEQAVRDTADFAKEGVSGADVLAALDAAHEYNFTLAGLFAESGASLLLTPTVAAQAPLLDQFGVLNGQPDPNWVRFTYPFNLTRSPVGTVNAGWTAGGLPVGLQLVGRQHDDLGVLRGLVACEAILGPPRFASVG